MCHDFGPILDCCSPEERAENLVQRNPGEGNFASAAVFETMPVSIFLKVWHGPSLFLTQLRKIALVIEILGLEVSIPVPKPAPFFGSTLFP